MCFILPYRLILFSEHLALMPLIVLCKVRLSDSVARSSKGGV